MTVGRFEPKFKHRRSTTFLNSAEKPQSAVVIGAGLAGSAVACELARRGVQVQVVDAGPVGASGASALRWGVVHAQPSGDDNQLFRLTRSGLEMLRKSCSAIRSWSGLRGFTRWPEMEPNFKNGSSSLLS